MDSYYRDSLEHITDELRVVDLRLQALVSRHRATSRVADDGFQGLYIAEREVDGLLEKAADPNAATERGDGEAGRLAAAAESLRTQIDERVKLSLEKGVRLRLARLAHLYELSTAELEILVACLAPHVDARYPRLYAYLQDDVTRKSPTVSLLCSLAGGSPDAAFSLRPLFSGNRTLLGRHLLEAVEDPYDKSGAMPTRALVADARIAGYLLECDDIDERLSGAVELSRPQEGLAGLALPPEVVNGLSGVIELSRGEGTSESFIFSFCGPQGAGKRDAAEAVCAELGMPFLTVDVPALKTCGLPFELAVRLTLRESALLPAAVYFQGCDTLFGQEDGEHLRKAFLRELDDGSFLSFLGSTTSLNLQGRFRRQRFIEIDLPRPGYEQQLELWRRSLAGHPTAVVDLQEIAAKYSLTRGQIADAVATAGSYAVWRSPKKPAISQDDVRRACHVHSNKNLDKLASRIQPKYHWDDLVLQPEAVEQLKDMLEMITYKPIVHDRWGFDGKLTLGKGVSALFHGEPGTGKTMAANVIANELGMELYKIDLSTVVSKYIGETEKNLSRIFQEAESSNAVLFFDEADALFGKRTEVKDAHDRYANVEVSYLLQRIDEFSGIVILASNFSQNIDEAFERRLRFIVHFPFPDEQSRLRIWKGVFPRETPIAPDIDFPLLAQKLRISGGNIANIALTAAFYAARCGGPVRFEHLLQACRNEYRKTGRLWNAEELSPAASGR